ncbi:MAG: type 4a pilus biogenesis protein PilO [Planctomycetota bacterium]
MQLLPTIHPKLLLFVSHAAGVAAVALSLLAYNQLVHQPLRGKQAGDEHRVTQLRGLMENAIETRRSHVELQKQFTELTNRVNETQELTPGASREAEFLRVVNTVAAENGVDIKDYRRGRARHLPTHSEVDITLSMEGQYAEICRLLAKVDALQRAKRITDLQIDATGARETYPMSISYTLYFGLRTPAEPAGAT